MNVKMIALLLSIRSKQYSYAKNALHRPIITQDFSFDLIAIPFIRR